MAISSKPITTSYQIRSISFPFRSHSNILKIEEELKKLDTLGASSMPLQHTKRILGLAALYKCVEELLNLPMTQQAIAQYQSEKWVDELLDGSVRVLDICGITRDMVSQIKEHVRDLQCALRRRKGDSSIESSIDKFTFFRKKIQKDAKKLITNLKQVDNINGGSEVVDLDHHLVVVIRVLTKVSEVTVSVFESLFLFFYVKPKPSRWSIVSKMMHKGRVACEGQQGSVNELENLDAALLNVCRFGPSEEDNIENAQNRLEAMEGYIESIQSGLDCLFRELIRTRALLLNIMSQ